MISIGGFGRGITALPGKLSRSIRQIGGLCVMEDFLDEARRIRHAFKVEKRGARRSVCKTCGNPARSIECKRPVFLRSIIYERKVKEASWSVPFCITCDRAAPSCEITDPVLIMNPSRGSGFKKLPNSVRKFFGLSLKDIE